MKITPTKIGFIVKYTTREIWGVDDDSEVLALTKVEELVDRIEYSLHQLYSLRGNLHTYGMGDIALKEVNERIEHWRDVKFKLKRGQINVEDFD